MSRRDNLHASLRRILEKDGWLVTDDQQFQIQIAPLLAHPELEVPG